MLAGYLYIPKSAAPVQIGEGAILGAMAGVVAGDIAGILADFAGDIAGILAGILAGVGCAARVLIFSGDGVAGASDFEGAGRL